MLKEFIMKSLPAGLNLKTIKRKKILMIIKMGKI